jgi:hypothetical protein
MIIIIKTAGLEIVGIKGRQTVVILTINGMLHTVHGEN